MAKNYGIGFCERGISVLEETEENLFATTGFGFDKFSQEYRQLCEYRRLLAKFKREKDAGMVPSYDPHIHGSFEH